MATQDFGTADFGGATYTLTQDAYISNYGTAGCVRYYAHATDAAGDTFLVAWDTTEAWDLACERASLEGESDLDGEQLARLGELQAMGLPNVEDESNACDWANPVSVKRQ